VTSQLGITILADLQQDIIETDDSLMPFSDIKKEYINTVPKAFDSSYFIKSSSHPNAEIIFKKSTKTVTYSRTFNKVDAYLSYVGGLVGTIIGLSGLINTDSTEDCQYNEG